MSISTRLNHTQRALDRAMFRVFALVASNNIPLRDIIAAHPDAQEVVDYRIAQDDRRQAEIEARRLACRKREAA